MRQLHRLLLLAGLAGCATAGGAAGEVAQGEKDLAAGRPSRAYDHFEEALSIDPGDEEAFRHAVEAARPIGKLDALTAPAASEVRAHPERAQAHYRYGLCLFAHTDGERAGLAELANAAQIDPHNLEYTLREGVALLESDRPAEAVSVLKAAVVLAPGEAHPRVPLALALHRAGDDSGAIDQVAQALPLLPSPPDLNLLRRLMDRVLEPSGAVPAQLRGRFSMALDALAPGASAGSATDLLEELAGEQPTLAPVQTALGLAYLRDRDNTRAVSHLRRAVELDPRAAEPHLYLGQIFRELHQGEQARAELRLAIARDPMLDVAHDELEAQDEELGDDAEAVREARSLVGLRGGDLATRLRLAHALRLSGDLSAAEGELKTVASEATDDVQGDLLSLRATRLEAELELGGVEIDHAQQVRDPLERGRLFVDARARLDEVHRSQPNNTLAAQLLAQIPR